jgi:steroid delta-isomerase-like uncharacterized protein
MVNESNKESHRRASDDNKALVRRWMEEAINRKNINVVDELMSPDYVSHVPGMPDLHGPDGEKQFDSMFNTAFPDGVISIEHEVAEGDFVALHLSYRGTHQGEMMGIPPTGTQITMAGMHLCRIADGKIVEAWAMPDMLGMLQQLGVVPPPGQA